MRDQGWDGAGRGPRAGVRELQIELLRVSPLHVFSSKEGKGCESWNSVFHLILPTRLMEMQIPGGWCLSGGVGGSSGLCVCMHLDAQSCDQGRLMSLYTKAGIYLFAHDVFNSKVLKAFCRH